LLANDSKISQAIIPLPIIEIAKKIGLLPEEIELFGAHMAKINLDVNNFLQNQQTGKYVIVTAITPTPFGEGKTTTTIGLADALSSHLGKKAFACLRQPSMGPTFGIKGGGAGGGRSKVVPAEDFNLHLTGDMHAVSSANNLLAAAIDARILHEGTESDQQLFEKLCPKTINGSRKLAASLKNRLQNLGIKKSNLEDLTDEEITKLVRLNIKPNNISWHRVMDISDRFLRTITIGEGVTEKSFARSTSFDITPASEIMAILALTSGRYDLRQRLARMIIAFDKQGKIITADDLGITGALLVLLKDAVKPNLMQTMEGTPVLVHTGPFANIARGSSSIIADKIALNLAGSDGYVITEAGFGSDIGFEKFCNIKCREGNLIPNTCVLVATVKALKEHGEKQNLEDGCKNLIAHLINIKRYGLPVVVAINRFHNDAPQDLELIKKIALQNGAYDAVITNHFTEGGLGAANLAKAVMKASKQPSSFSFLYDKDKSIQEKIKKISETYGAASVEYSPLALKKIEVYNAAGLCDLLLCMAKTQFSFSHDPKLKGSPKGFCLPINDIYANTGAGFLFALCGEINTMPGLPTRPAFYDIDIDFKTNKIVGMF